LELVPFRGATHRDKNLSFRFSKIFAEMTPIGVFSSNLIFKFGMKTNGNMRNSPFYVYFVMLPIRENMVIEKIVFENCTGNIRA
jgi:hypothetical protein